MAYFFRNRLVQLLASDKQRIALADPVMPL